MTLVPPSSSGVSGSREMLGGESPRSKARREMYGLGSSVPITVQLSKGKEPAPQIEEDEEDYELENDEDYVNEPQATVSTLPFGCTPSLIK